VNALLRHPTRYLSAHWIVTGALATALLFPHTLFNHGGSAAARTITLLTGQVVHLNADGTPQPSPDLREGHLFSADTYALPGNVGPASVLSSGLRSDTGASVTCRSSLDAIDTLAREYSAEAQRTQLQHAAMVPGDELIGPTGATVVLASGASVHVERAKPHDARLLDSARLLASGVATSFVEVEVPVYTSTPTGALTAGAACSFLDPQLFDVTYLAANGYDDASTDRIPVIVQFDSAQDAARAVSLGTEDGIHFTHAFEYVPDAMGYVSKHGPFVSPLPDYADGIESIYLDGRVTVTPDTTTQGDAAAQPIGPSLAEAIPLIGADVAQQRGLTGKGIKIAVVDTGIDAAHGDLAGRIVAARDFSTDGNVHDYFGHGTHVAGIAAGTGALSDGKYGGVAPQASLINAKALSKNGSGSLSGIMRAMEWAADQGANIENLSLGGGASDGKDPLSQDVNNITARKNVLFVIAAGNAGPRGKVSTPAAADSALAVAAIDKQRVLAPFSSRGPRTGDMAVKPEIAAPGVRITAPRANHGDDDPYATYSGTSMATPMVAGAAALVMQLHPDWPALKVKDALMNGANPIGDGEASYVSVYEQGAGMVDLRNMLDQQVLIQPANLSFGIVKSNDQKSIDLTFRNLTDQALTLDLQGSLHRVEGTGTAQFDISAPTVDLPPSGTATIKVTVKGGSAKGLFSGDILAVNDGKTLARVAAGFTLR
jgi:subtilisin family serine protease